MSVTLEIGLTVGERRCGLLDLGSLDNDLFNGDLSLVLTAQLADNTVPGVSISPQSAVLIVLDNEGMNIINSNWFTDCNMS